MTSNLVFIFFPFNFSSKFPGTKHGVCLFWPESCFHCLSGYHSPTESEGDGEARGMNALEKRRIKSGEAWGINGGA